LKISLFVSTKSTNVIDGRTDRRTPHDGIGRTCAGFIARQYHCASIKCMHLYVSDVHCTEVDCIMMGRRILYDLLICCWWWWSWWSYVAGVERDPCSPGCQCVYLHSTSSDNSSRLSAVDWHRLMIAYRLQQKYDDTLTCCLYPISSRHPFYLRHHRPATGAIIRP